MANNEKQTVEYWQEMYRDCFPKDMYGYWINYPFEQTMQLIQKLLQRQVKEHGVVMIIMQCIKIAHLCIRCGTKYWCLGICTCNEAITSIEMYSLEVELWIKCVVKLPQYYHTLIDSGFDRMMFIAEIEKWHLQHIGVTNKKHINRILQAVSKICNKSN